MLLATWTTACWALLPILRWRRGQAMWQGSMRFVTAGLAAIGAVLLGMTGSRGGYLIGANSDAAQVLRKLGWQL